MKFYISSLLFSVLFTIGCSAQQSEEQALSSLREMTRGGNLPPESVVASIESRFADKKTGALARLLRARIKFENGDYPGAAAILNSNVFTAKTSIADHALWLRGRSLLFANDFSEAAKVFEQLVDKYPGSIRAHDATIGWAMSELGGNSQRTEPILSDLLRTNDPEAFIVMARGAEGRGDKPNAVKYYRFAYFYAPAAPFDPKTHLVADPAAESESKLKFFSDDMRPRTAEEFIAFADRMAQARKFADAAALYQELAARFPSAVTNEVQVKRLSMLASSGKTSDAQAVLNSMPASAPGRDEAYRQLALGYARARLWPQARIAVDELRQRFAASPIVPKTMMEIGSAARDARYRADDSFYFGGLLASYPNAIEAAGAQFEIAWSQHENKNYSQSASMFIDHLTRYVDKDTTNRGKAGYWAARDSERAGNVNDACVLYEAVNYRYSANWYGYLAQQRLASLKATGNCSGSTPSVRQQLAAAAANLKTVTIAAETSTAKELDRLEKGDELGAVGLFDWAIDELQEAKKSAANSPKINLALAKHYRLKGDQVNALLSLAKSYPDYAQMFPEEMGRQEWDIFYPLTNWSEIAYWAKERGLDPYQVAGIIRQETIFDPNARSNANAYGLMQLLVPTANSMAKKYVSKTSMVTPTALYQAPLNIELGTAYMKDQFDKFGLFELVGVAYNAGPGRVPQWRATLPAEMDEFVEAIPFKETKGYVQGIIRNAAQYRRLYDETGNFRANVGSKPLRSEIESKPREQFTAENPDVFVDDKSE